MNTLSDGDMFLLGFFFLVIGICIGTWSGIFNVYGDSQLCKEHTILTGIETRWLVGNRICINAETKQEIEL